MLRPEGRSSLNQKSAMSEAGAVKRLQLLQERTVVSLYRYSSGDKVVRRIQR